jgi:hypothetical protein
MERREILWESETATEAEARQKEIEPEKGNHPQARRAVCLEV